MRWEYKILGYNTQAELIVMLTSGTISDWELVQVVINHGAYAYLKRQVIDETPIESYKVTVDCIQWLGRKVTWNDGVMNNYGTLIGWELSPYKAIYGKIEVETENMPVFIALNHLKLCEE